MAPHLDDAALSLGASIFSARRLGALVTVLTVFAGDPDSRLSAGSWDVITGFATAGDAARERRREDVLASEILGTATQWLPFPDEQYASTVTDDEIWSAVAPHLVGANLVLLPGHPLTNADHARLTRLVFGRIAPGASIALYVEQPYASWVRFGHGPLRVVLGASAMRASGRRRPLPVPKALADLVSAIEWRPARPSRADWRAKQLAIRAYESQISHLGRWLLSRIALYEAAWGGEGIGIPVLAPAVSRRPSAGAAASS